MWSRTAQTIVDDEGWRSTRRVPQSVLDLADNAVLTAVASQPASVRFRFRPDGDELRIEIHTDRADGLIDLVVDDGLIERRSIPEGSSEQVFALPGGEVAELWLPQAAAVATRDVTVDGAPPRSIPFPNTQWISYGSSITHCGSAHGPSQTWPAAVAGALGLNNESIGLSGQCHLDPGIADYIAASRPDVVTLCLGINVYGGSSYSRRTWAPVVGDFVERVAAAGPKVLVIGPIGAPDREDEVRAGDMTLAEFRSEVERATAIVSRRFGSVSYLDGRTLIGIDEADDMLEDDRLHPTGDGHLQIASRLSEHLRGIWFS